ncbi:MAG: beta-1,6-N-acetylglucosaminyltransferase [Chitinophagaceae bacterium]
MNKAYIILAHKNIEQLVQTLERLNDQSSYFFIHIDSKMHGLHPSIFLGFGDKVHLMERIDTKWAGFSLVQATLNAMKAIKETGRQYHTITLLSGQDYPIKSNRFIDDFFRNSHARVFIEHFEMPNYERWRPNGGMYRLDKYYFGLKSYELFSSRVLNFLCNFLTFLKRKQPLKLQPYGGSQWWTIDMYSLDYILKYVKTYPAYSLFHKSTFAPDELFFQTILLNAKDDRIVKSIVNSNYRFVRWSSSSKSHPETLQLSDLNDIVQSDALFARKLDVTEHPELFELIDKHCLNKEQATA